MSQKSLFTYFAVFTVMILASTHSASAANLEIANGGTYRNPGLNASGISIVSGQEVDPSEVCAIRINGEIAAGDLEKLESIAKKVPDNRIPGIVLRHVVCLNSSGGLFVEAVRIAKYLRENHFGTKLDESDTCLSACAIIFLSGSFVPLEHDGIKSWRVMHPKAKLGFHRPSIVVKQGTYSESDIERAYNVAMDTSLLLMEQRAPASLLKAIFKTPSDEINYLDTVDEAGRWDVTIWPIKQKTITKFDAYIGCTNFESWLVDETAIGHKSWSQEERRIVEYNVEPKDNGTFDVTTDEMGPVGCLVDASAHDTYTTSVVYRTLETIPSRDGAIRSDSITFFEPHTRLSDTYND